MQTGADNDEKVQGTKNRYVNPCYPRWIKLWTFLFSNRAILMPESGLVVICLTYWRGSQCAVMHFTDRVRRVPEPDMLSPTNP